MTGAAGAALCGALGAGATKAARAVPALPDAVPFGAAVRPMLLGDDADYSAAVRRHCSLLVPEGGLKWFDLRPTPTVYNFDLADRVMRFAADSNMGVRGHTLVWHGAMPEWTSEITSTARAETEMRTHIETIMGRYGSQIESWDVVNEPISTDFSKSDYLQPCVWLHTMGEDYIEQALRTARAISPTAQLVVNEYGIEAANAESVRKRAALLKLLRRLKERGAPFDAVGLQCHLHGERPIDRDGLAAFLSELAAMKLDVLVTELDVIDDKLPGDFATRDAAIAGRVDELLETLFAVQRPTAILTWGISDRHTWVPMYFKRGDGTRNRPLPLDENYQPKPMLRVIERYCRR